MRNMRITLGSIDDIKNLINVTNGEKCDIDLVSGRYIIDGKSIMGVFSLDLSKPISLIYHGDDESADLFVNKIKAYLIPIQG